MMALIWLLGCFVALESKPTNRVRAGKGIHIQSRPFALREIALRDLGRWQSHWGMVSRCLGFRACGA